MFIAHRDFVPLVLREGFFSSDYEPLESTVARANEWMAQVGARVVNLETILLPNLKEVADASANGIRTSGESSTRWFQVVRVWYEHDGRPPA